MRVSIVIPSLNSPIIDRVLHAVLQQDGIETVNEIIIVGKDDPALLTDCADPRIHFIDTGEPVIAAQARNIGIEHGTGDVIIFLDSDCLPSDGWLMGHIAAQLDGHSVVSGSVEMRGEGFWHLIYNISLFHRILQPQNVGQRDFLATLNLAVSRKVIDQVGGMDGSVNRVEDVDWTIRMRREGIQPYFWSSAPVYHLHNRTTLRRVWRDCALSGYHMRRLRLHHRDLLQAPLILRSPLLVLLLSPLIALWATLRIIWQTPFLIPKWLHTLPAIYLTKVAWCWGASRRRDPAQRPRK